MVESIRYKGIPNSVLRRFYLVSPPINKGLMKFYHSPLVYCFVLQLQFDTLLPSDSEGENFSPKESDSETLPLPLDQAMSRHIENVLKITKGKVHGPGGAAELLAIKPNTLRARMDKLGIRFGRKKA